MEGQRSKAEGGRWKVEGERWKVEGFNEVINEGAHIAGRSRVESWRERHPAAPLLLA